VAVSPAQKLDRILQVTGREMSVPGRHMDGLVPHQLLNRFQGYTSHDQPAAEGVPEAVPTEIPNFGFGDGLLGIAVGEEASNLAVHRAQEIAAVAEAIREDGPEIVREQFA